MASANDKEANFSSAETCLPNFLAASCLYNRGNEEADKQGSSTGGGMENSRQGSDSGLENDQEPIILENGKKCAIM